MNQPPGGCQKCPQIFHVRPSEGVLSASLPGAATIRQPGGLRRVNNGLPRANRPLR